MIVDIDKSHAADLAFPEWSAAEVLDTAFSDDLLLRAIICRLGAGKWQWSITSVEGQRGELISVGVEKSVIAARLVATSEIAKCLENALE